ncbi:MAG TPA: hypothetical protein V6D12_24110 [Candidatus Obscuribacterales bacterium]
MEQLSTEERSDLKRSPKGSAKKSAIAFKGSSALELVAITTRTIQFGGR